ncbi:TPA: EscC/YscC/HrcC family type III secretion system outer membrane ring protein [Escherichia coli]|uniref:type III secretion system outer membrane ring subunit SctC n=1 Tax=Escherichia coli TaxID=562 RepID=UPI000B7E6D43|nr:type III secretion system outer membrane ring subunit SctC [Escherichia coli]MEC9881369.1 type III secretion system outer membrane ring subunit SctC [Escherichia marmotae]KAE9932486.1 EscC/YscC/HrcC family type III secretion system outer membrane ring protein [Escherichia coli]MCL0891150.1 type III secretion system outer membrane ring subunit SctC [Escherichia coli]MCL0912616.1 type III secretion system outer membrane ring subunit SctC [Escherichia coli]MEB7083329.1 type III secretion syste
MKLSNIIIIFIILLFGISPFSIATGSETLFDNGYVARNDSLNSFFEAMSTKLNKTVVVSKSASRKKINGNFNFRDPEALLDRLASQLGVIWYSDGQTIYIYDAEEIRNSVISLQNISLSAFKSFLKEAGLYDSRYPLKGDEQNGIVYISGPPIFVSIVTKTAALIDKQNNDIEMGRLKIGVFRLHNTFVNDRTYQLRDQSIVIPGIATVIEKLLTGEQQNLTGVQGGMLRASGSNIASEALSGNSSTDNEMYIDEARDSTTSSSTPISDIKVISYPDTNSLLVKGTAEQVDFIGALIRLLDVAKRHVELSLWIIDLNKNDLEQLGVAWGGSTSFSNKLDMALNQTLVSTLDGVHFLASVYALEKKNQARIVSKPVLMTQENVPAIFDNNRTFYTKLIGERNSSLAHVTYGTMISVLPRFSADGEIEMSLNIEDGNEEKQSVSGNEDSVLPEVGRTHISTVARVPQGKSLLIGGYTRDSRTKDVQKIPLLGDIPLIGGLFRYENQNQNNVVRVFLIQPKEILDPLMPDADVFAAELMQDSGIENNRDPLDKWVLSYLNRGQALNHGK